jgi:hypothetical protein
MTDVFLSKLIEQADFCERALGFRFSGLIKEKVPVFNDGHPTDYLPSYNTPFQIREASPFPVIPSGLMPAG